MAIAASGDGGGPSSGNRWIDNNRVDREDLYTGLWQSCAGRLFYIPKVGEEVYYFPQGHIEQVKCYANKDDQSQMPIYNLPSKILCRVVNVHLKAEARTDEVYAQFILLPLSEEAEATAVIDDRSIPPERAQVCFFSKTLTASDTLPHGGFTLPKRHAYECLPPLDMSQDRPMQSLIMNDLHGQEWPFSQIYRGRPKRHLFTNGWSKFVSTKKLVVGDTVIYLRGKNGELRIGIRRSMRSPRSASASVLSCHSMIHGVLANVAHAVSTVTLFSVFCHPWTCPSCFIIPTAQYIKSEEKDYSIGTRFRMLFENEECVEQRFTGTVVGIEDIDPIRWPGSKWRCLKVNWDSPPQLHQHPERISPWNIEPLPSKKKKQGFDQVPPKKPCLHDFCHPGTSSSSVKNDCRFRVSNEYQPEMLSGVLQCQEKNVERGKPPKVELGISDYDVKAAAPPDGLSSLKLFRVKIVDTSAELHSAQTVISIDGHPPIPPDHPTSPLNIPNVSGEILQ